MTDTLSFFKFQNLRKLPVKCALVLIFLLATVSSYARVFRPIQILLPGNFNGAAITLQPTLKTASTYAWRIPDTLSAFRQTRDKETIVFATGNDSNIFSPLSFLSGGAFERNLIDECRPDAQALSPHDLEMFNDSRLDGQIRKKIFTNLLSDDGPSVFLPYATKSIDNRQIWFFNFIAANRCEALPMQNWGIFSIDNPARTIRRLNPAFSDQDLSFSVIDINSEDLDELIKELKQRQGFHFVMQIVKNGEQPIFSSIDAERDQNIYKISLISGTERLPLINIFPRNNGFPRVTLRMLPLDKTEKGRSESLFTNACNSFKKHLYETLKVIKTTTQASSSVFSFRAQTHAQLIKVQTACDVAFLLAPPTVPFSDNVICTGNIITNIPNDRVQKFRLTGRELVALSELLIINRGAVETAFAGCEFLALGGQAKKFTVSHQPVEQNKVYLVATTENTASDPILRDFFTDRVIEPFDGTTLWKVWKNNLKTLRISDSYLFD
ncbi:MAG: hypothetical protein EOM80_03040 [Erysipelotrichia bacterium]|nr:hypothetical protein [Erysipelotrichia bacterium]